MAMLKSGQPLAFSGDHYEVGRQIGKYYKFWDKKVLYVPPLTESVYKQQLATYTQYYPDYLVLAEGVAAGMDKNPNRVIRSLLTRTLEPAKYQMKSCSVLAVNTSAGPLIGRAYDWRQSAIKSTKHYSIDWSNSSNAFNAVSDMGVWQVGKPDKPSQYYFEPDDIWNEHGLFISMNGAPGKPMSTGMLSTHLIQLVAEKCKTVKEAVSILNQIPCNEPKLFTLVDSTGNMCVVEKNQDNCTRLIKSNNYICVTNHFQHPDFLTDNMQLFLNEPFHSTYARHAYLSTALASHKPASTAEIKKLMLKQPIVQNWHGAVRGDMVTIWVGLHDYSRNTHKTLFAPFS